MDNATKTDDPLAWSREDFIRCWKQLPEKGFFFCLLGALFVLFHLFGHCQFNFTKEPSLFSWMWGAWGTVALDSSHGKLIPVVVAVLVWVRREPLIQSVGKPWWPALVGLAVCLFFHVFSYAVQQPRFSIIAFFGCLYCVMGLVWGWRLLKASFFPFFLFAFCVPLGNFIDTLTLPLRMVSTSITAVITRDVLGVPLIHHGTQLMDVSGAYNYDVAAACSGIRSFTALLAIATIYAMLSFRSQWRRGVMIVLTVPIVLVCNVLRLTAIVLAAKAWGPSAGAFVHEWFGFVTYGIALIILMVAASWLDEQKALKKT